MTASISKAEFDVLVGQTGLPLSDAQKAEIYGAYGILEGLIARLQTPLPREVEPAHMFTTEVR